VIERLDERAVQKASGSAWKPLREDFFKISKILLSVSPDTRSQLTTIYVKFCTTNGMSEVFAVVWIKTSKALIVGLSLPKDFEDVGLGPPPTGLAYKGLTKFFTVTLDDPIPNGLLGWAKLAYKTASCTDKD